MNPAKTTFQKRGKPVILIADDIPKNIQVLGQLLNQFDCDLVVALNGQQAIDSAKKTEPDLILLDIMMPVLDGYEVCKQLKADENYKDIPIIFLTAKVETEDLVKGFELGGADYITKPFIANELIARVKTHLKLKETQDALREEIATKNKFSSIIAHDLRGPLSTIHSIAKLMVEENSLFDKEEMIASLRKIAEGTSGTFYLMENLFEWSRMQTCKLCIHPEKVRLKEMIEETVSQIQIIANQKNISIENKVEDKVWVRIDKLMINTVLRNLISNAIKFTPKLGHVSISAINQEDKVVVSVCDTGVGIAPELLPRLFSISENITTKGTENEKGSGLGLVLCKEFVEKNEGQIWVESEPGKGSEFKFSLPV